MKKTVYLLLLILCILFSNNIYLQSQSKSVLSSEYSYHRYSMNDGLPENLCWDLYQDSEGFIWIGTNAGLARYDGYKFDSYLSKSEATLIAYITENLDGNLSVFDGKSIYTLDRDEEMLSGALDFDWTLYAVESTNLPEGYGLFINGERNMAGIFSIRDTSKILLFEFKDNLLGGQRVHWDRENKSVYYTGRGDNVIVISEEGKILDSISSPDIYAFIPFRKDLWAIAQDGIYKLSGRSFQLVYKENFSLNPGDGLNALVDNEDNLLIQTLNTVYRFDGETLKPIFNELRILDMLLDNENNLWIATDNGLYNCFKLNFVNHILNTIKSDVISSFISDDKGNVWLASIHGELIVVDNESVKTVSYPHTPNESSFYGNPASTPNGLFFPNSGMEGVLHCKDGKCNRMNIPKRNYLFATSYTEEKLVLAGQDFACIFDMSGKIIKEYNSIRDLMQNGLLCVDTDGSGRIYFGGVVGVTIVDGDNIKLISHESKKCTSIQVDKDNKIWAACGNTIYQIINDTLTPKYTFQDMIQGVYMTKHNILIVLTPNGFYISDKPENGFIYYSEYNGFSGERLHRGNIIEDSDGNVWLRASKMTVSFKPEKLLREQIAPLLHLMSVQTSGNNIHWKAKEKVLFPVLNHTENNIRFNYTGLCYSATENVRYQYRLKSFQDEWSEPVTSREVTFNNLNPGNYEFQIKAFTGTSDLESNIISFPFSLNPAFWQTSLFWVVCAALLMLSGAGIMLYFQRKKNAKLIERLDTERQLNELKISSIRLKAIPHFNANVMSAIEYYIMNKSKEDAMRILGEYSRFTFETLQDVDRSSRSLSEELKYVKMYLELEKLRFIDKFDYEVTVGDNVDADKVKLPNMLLHTWTENAVKHGLSSKTSGGKVIIKAVQSGDIAFVSVEDNGVGREAASNNPHTYSSKQGLSILSKQIEIYNRFNNYKINQNIEDLYTDGRASGTRFSLKIPVSFNYEL